MSDVDFVVGVEEFSDDWCGWVDCLCISISTRLAVLFHKYVRRQSRLG